MKKNNMGDHINNGESPSKRNLKNKEKVVPVLPLVCQSHYLHYSVHL